MSLAIAEKRSQRPGGCVGIFFQLLDWNRRLAKKKLFSRRLLPPVRAAKKASKKFGGGGDDKRPMAKRLLIADENRGGLPNAKKSDDLGDGMRAPGLVARLMGLESMPVVAHEKPRKALDSDRENARGRGGSGFPGLDQGLCPEMGGLGKLESRPQKLQKTGGFLERRPTSVGRPGPDGFSKSVLSSRSRKQHHKLASPVKSPRLLPRNHKARLVQVATRILEPGLQSKNRAKCAITYTGSSQADTEEGSDGSLSLKRSQILLNGSLVGSCSSCGGLVEVSELRLGEKEPLESDYGCSALEFSNASCSHDSSLEGKNKLSFLEGEQSRITSIAVQAKANVQNKSQDLLERKKHIQNDQDTCKPQQDGMPRPTPKKNNLRQCQLTSDRDKVDLGLKMCGRRQSRRDPNELNESKDFVALNRNVNEYLRTRSTSKVPDSHRVEIGRNGWERNMTRKRAIKTSHIENGGAVSSTFEKSRSFGSKLINRKVTVPSGNRSINRNSVKGELQKKDGSHNFHGRNDYTVLFTFDSTMKHGAGCCANGQVVEKSRDQGELNHDASYPKHLELDPKSGNLISQMRTALRGHELSNLLEQKIREPTSLVPDEFGNRDPRSTASFLEELRSALMGGALISEENDGCYDTHFSCADLPDIPISQSPMHNDNKYFQEDVKIGKSAAYTASGNDQSSPISILKASFSNDSCSFRSHNGSPVSGGKLHFGLMGSCNTTVPLDRDNDLLDSATFIDITRSDIEKISHSNYRSSTKINEVKLPESKISNASEIILNAELLFQNFSLCYSDGLVESSIKYFLLDMLESMVHAFVMGPKNCSDYMEAEQRNQIREFIFDCIIECLDLKCSQFCKSGYKTWLELPLLSMDQLTREVQEQIKWWMGLAGKFSDDLIEKEMSHSTGKWMAPEIETFETGMEVERNILRALVDEMVIDLCGC